MVTKNGKRVRFLCILLPKVSGHRAEFGQAKCMSFLIKDDKLLEKYNEIWKKYQQHLKRIWLWTCVQWKIRKL